MYSIIKWNNVSLTHSEYLNVGILVIVQVLSKTRHNRRLFLHSKTIKIIFKTQWHYEFYSYFNTDPATFHCHSLFVCLFICYVVVIHAELLFFVTASLNGKVG